MSNKTIEEGSFRDPNGFIFVLNNTIYRQVNYLYKDNFDHLISSGLHESLVKDQLLVPFKEADPSLAVSGSAYKIICPDRIKVISYPYEWSFSQYKDAALLTLQIQKKALEYGMSLKDASAYNIQFQDSKPIFIDTLSFEKYKDGEPWIAYRQFCQHFLAPLALMAYTDVRLQQLMKVYIDGVPLDLASALLPGRSKLHFSLLSHIHLHAKGQKKYENVTSVKKRKISKFLLLSLIDNLEGAINNLRWRPKGTEWGNYYEDTNYTDQAMENKKTIINGFLDKISPSYVWDLGANTGLFSRLASKRGILTVAFDIDPAAVEKNYLLKGDKYMLPLIIDVSNPSPGLGWENKERMSFFERALPDTVFALALIHHLAISNNLPLSHLASFFSKICRHLIIEFIPKSDSQVQRLLATREDIFDNYTEVNFEKEFLNYFSIREKIKVANSERTVFLMASKNKI
jgi:ribosomal protein L11 methylase PrmA